MTASVPRRAAALYLTLLAAACTTPQSQVGPAATASAVQARVQALLEQARLQEPKVTPRLIALATSANGEMVKLEHRLKTEASATRKLNKHLAEHPEAEPGAVILQDMLRYTMRVEDEPPGNYVETIRRALATLEKDGHAVTLVKNSWARGDNYSGVNVVLKTASGLPWELQFHTSASLKVQHETRAQYEELRRQSTPVDRQRVLFDAMARAWDEVPLPAGILEDHALHPTEHTRTYDRP